MRQAVWVFTVGLGLLPCGVRAEEGATFQVIHSSMALPPEVLAAREVQRYLYVRTGALASVAVDVEGSATNRVVVGTAARSVVDRISRKRLHPADTASLRGGEYLVRTFDTDEGRLMLIVGGDAHGVLHGAYRLAEYMGMRFYLEGDVAPAERIAPALPTINEKAMPHFETRGIQPFHDFPEGPDWWSEEGYKAIIGQLPKLKMNFIGFHTYPEGDVGPEPMVWIGRPEDLNDDGTVKASYPARHFCTLNGTWGYTPKTTSDYHCGASALFEHDAYTQDAQVGTCPWPKTPEEQNELFNRFGRKLRNVFVFARYLGVRTCMGTEVPLVVPKEVKERMLAGRTTTQPTREDVQRLYEGMFARIMKTHPLDAYWFWTPEGWTWKDVTTEEVDATIADIKLAIAAAEKVGVPFALGTCGWVLGPQYDRSLFHKVLPESMFMSWINRAVGHDPVEPGFEPVIRWEKWAIPWLEDDPALIVPQLWVGRMRKDALDANRYGCSGLLGIHWRTRALGPNVSALATAAWDTSTWRNREPTDEKKRFIPSEDFWLDWAKTQFGAEAGEKAGQLFARIDCRLPRPATWVGGPGGLNADKRPWADVSKEYAFVDELAALRPTVKGAVNLDRFDWWLNQMRYLRATGRLCCTWARFDEAMAKVKAEKDAAARKRLAEETALPLRKEMVATVNEIYDYLLATVGNTGEMGTIANWEQHLFPTLLDKPGEELAEALGIVEKGDAAMPPGTVLSKTYEGQARMFVPEVRGTLLENEPLTLRMIVLDREPAREVAVHWRPIGKDEYSVVAGKYVARGVWTAALPAEASAGPPFEYYITGLTASGAALNFPVGAPQVTQTVVATPLERYR